MLTCNAETNILNRYAPPGIGLLCFKFILLLDNSRTIWEASSQKHIGGNGGKEYLIRWRLSAIIAYGVIMHWAGWLRWCCLRHEMSCSTRDDDFPFHFSFFLLVRILLCVFLVGGRHGEVQVLEADGIRV